MKPTYIQIFSMTDHAKALNARYQGPYKGVNFDIQTSESSGNKLVISKNTKTQSGGLDEGAIGKANVILAYRHTDTGELSGTSEMLLPIETLPWSDLPGLEMKSVQDGQASLKLWVQDFKLDVGKIVCIRFMKTIAYLKSFGPMSEVSFTSEILENGPSKLHSFDVDEELTIAPPSGSGFQVKMGQEIKD